MKSFPLCHDCRHEYEDVDDRRFHAETLACPHCGPRLSFLNHHGFIEDRAEVALNHACTIIRNGKILAVKGLGGFQLWVNALSERSVEELRSRKHRPRKPFAVLFSSLEELRNHCLVSTKEASLLQSPESPIVLVEKRMTSSLATLVSPDNPYIGAMLPYTPLHHLLMDELRTPVVATSGNLSEEPLITEDQEALHRLRSIADAYLTHNRQIARPVDDSVARIVQEERIILRRARGYAPQPFELPNSHITEQCHFSVLAVGGHLKNTVAIATDTQVVVSQHIGDLDTVEANSAFKQTVTDQQKLFNVHPRVIACDLHPDYRSTRYAHRLSEQLQIPVTPVQHHHAHVASCMAEHGLEGPVLGVTWDGAGYGPDGTIWGGEFLRCDNASFERIAALYPFRLPGGEKCMREPRRTALSLLYETFGKNLQQLPLPFLYSTGTELTTRIISLLEKDVHCPVTTSMGRLFDGISSMLGLRHVSTFEGEAAMALEFAAGLIPIDDEPAPSFFSMPIENGRHGLQIIDWRPYLKQLVLSSLKGKTLEHMSQAFHQSLANLIVRVAENVGLSRVVLTGGVFQNVRLTTLATHQLRKSGYLVYTNRQYPTNDGGIAFGQAIIAQTRYREALNSE